MCVVCVLHSFTKSQERPNVVDWPHVVPGSSGRGTPASSHVSQARETVGSSRVIPPDRKCKMEPCRLNPPLYCFYRPLWLSSSIKDEYHWWSCILSYCCENHSSPQNLHSFLFSPSELSVLRAFWVFFWLCWFSLCWGLDWSNLSVVWLPSWLTSLWFGLVDCFLLLDVYCNCSYQLLRQNAK